MMRYNIHPIHSPDDPRIAVYRNLKDRELAREGGLFIAEGEHVVRRLLAGDFPVHSLLLAERQLEKIAPIVAESTPIYAASQAILNGIIGFKFHSGVIACGRRKPPLRLEQILPPPLKIPNTGDVADTSESDSSTAHHDPLIITSKTKTADTSNSEVSAVTPTPLIDVLKAKKDVTSEIEVTSLSKNFLFEKHRAIISVTSDVEVSAASAYPSIDTPKAGTHVTSDVEVSASRHKEKPMGEGVTLVICPEIANAENMGTLIRISAAFGADAMILGQRCCDPFWRQSIRVSMGTIFSLPILQSDDLIRDLNRLRKGWGVQLAAAVLDDHAESLSAARRPDRFGILFGNEAQGLDTCHMNACDRRITIPMKLGTDSLNVAVAAGIFLYHFTRE